MLTRRLRVALLWLVGAASASRAQDDDPLDALRRPERLTVATRDQFLGQLAPDQQTLYFVSNQDTRKEIYAQGLEDARARRVFDEAADVTWPRVSPDGKSLLYVSFSQQATGMLCVRDLPGGDNRRCLASVPAALQAEWRGRSQIVLVSRTSIDGDLRLSRVTVDDDELRSETLFDRNWTSPALSPDGRWLVYVPLDRMAAQVGPGFAARTAGKLEAVRLDRPGPPIPLPIDLPGLTGQPRFAIDGRALYFAQFFSDTNHDGLLDASDHGVLFRVPFESVLADAVPRAAAQQPRQLTDSSWNCQYPTPAAALLVATCSRGRDLDVYALPLDGQVPIHWTRERLRTELSLGGRREEQLLLYRQALGNATDPSWRRLITMRLVMAHLELEEFDAAHFYALKVKALRQPITRGIGRPLLALVEQRRARSARERGKLLETFADDARARMDELVDREKDSPAARVLNRVVRSEIADALGDKAAARRELTSVALEPELPRSVLDAYYARADALYRQLDDRESLVAVGRQLARREGLAPDVQLDYARASARALTRGLPREEALVLLARERATESADSEVGFALELMREVLAIRPGKPEPGVRERMIALYEAQTRPDRKRAIMLDAVQRAADLGADWVIECLAERYVDDVPDGTQERRRAERMFRRAIMGRAFRHISKGRFVEAQNDFDAVFRKTEALEALVEGITLRKRDGATRAMVEEQMVPPDLHDSPLASFVRAYLLAGEMRWLHGEAYRRAADDAQRALRRHWHELKDKGPARALLGVLMHQQFLHEEDYAAAETANAQYTVALELAQYDTRAQATLLGLLGLLHGQVGNHRIALDHLEQRARFPYGDDRLGLALRLATARARLHVGDDERSAQEAEQALAISERAPGLAKYRVLALDRAALSHLSGKHFERALALYDAEVPLLARDGHPHARRNRYVVPLARAAAALGAQQPQRTLQDLDAIARELEDEALVEVLTPPHVTEKQVVQSYGAIVSGLRANANLALQRLDAAHLALEQQAKLFAQRLQLSERDEDARALTLVQTRLAANAAARQDHAAAAKWLQLALQNADGLAARSSEVAELDVDPFHVLRFGAALQTLHKVPLQLDLHRRLGLAQQQLLTLKDPRHREHERWLEIYLVLSQR